MVESLLIPIEEGKVEVTTGTNYSDPPQSVKNGTSTGSGWLNNNSKSLYTTQRSIDGNRVISTTNCRRRGSVTAPKRSNSLPNCPADAIDEPNPADNITDTKISLQDNYETTNSPTDNNTYLNNDYVYTNHAKISEEFNNNNNRYHNNHNKNQYDQYTEDNFSKLEGMDAKTIRNTQSNVDIIGLITGEWGKWQLRTVLLIFLCKIPSSWFMACIIFTAPAPRHGEFFCKPPSTVGVQNQTLWIKVSHPQKEEVKDHEFNIDFCNVYQDAQEHAHHYYNLADPGLEPRVWEEPTSRNANVIPCTQFQHESDFHSVVTQYDLVCSRDILVTVTQFFHLFGVLTGGILANHLLKYFSPRYVMLFGMITQIFCGTLTGQVTSYELHAFFRCLSAVCCAQMYTAGGVIMADITGGKYKIWVSTLFEQFWSIGVILLPGVASFFSSWSHLYIAISWPTVILIYLWRWIPDSPRWMIARGRVIDAKNILLECADVNQTNHKIPYDLERQLQYLAQSAMEAPPPPGWWSIWYGKRVIKNILCVHICWAIYIVVYYGMLLNIRSYSREHLEVNTAIAGLSEIIGTFIGLLLILKSKRKWLYAGLFNIIAGIIALTGWLVPQNIHIDLRVALLMLTAMTSKVAISTTLSILTTCTIELVTEEKRKILMFSALCWARFWLLGAPFVGALIIFGQLMPQTGYVMLAICGGFFTAFITSERTWPQPEKTHVRQNMATFTQIAHIKGINNSYQNPVFTSINKMNLPTEFMPGTWTTKNQEENFLHNQLNT